VRAREPDVCGHVEVDGVGIGYEVFGDGEPAVLLLPTWTIIHSRHWKFQVPYLARRTRVVTFDGPGNGRSERSIDPDRYSAAAHARYAAAVLEQCGVGRAVVVGLSRGCGYAVHLATQRPDIVCGLVLVGAGLSIGPALAQRQRIAARFLDDAPSEPVGWDRYNLAYWHQHYEDFARWFFAEALSEPHSTKAHDDAVAWALETGPDVLGADAIATDTRRPESLLTDIACPTLVVHGSDDRMRPHEVGVETALLTGGRLLTFNGSGHFPHLRDPVRFNLAVRDFVDRVAASEAGP
jgi:pimeloyl-ACP methyl ester carboxylesterase